MKKKLLLLFFISVIGLSSLAQEYQVYSVKGEVTCGEGQNTIPAMVGMGIDTSTFITIPEGGRLVVLDESKKELYTMKNAVSGKMADVIQKEENSVQQLTDSYLTYIKSKMKDDGSPKDRNYRQSAASSYRDPDSLLLELLFHNVELDSTRKDTIRE